MGGSTVSRTAHFALHRLELDAPPAAPDESGPGAEGSATEGHLTNTPTGPGAEGSATEGRLTNTPTGPGSEGSKALFAVREPWIGALVPKRWAKRAVTRNTIKRQIYTVSQALEPPLPAAAHVVRLRSGFDRKHFVSATSEALKRAVRGELLMLFARAVK